MLCRADDWANRIDDALVAGRRAVALSSEDVLAHLFLSEALADHGDSAAAQQEIDAASRLLSAQSPAYQRAEVQREEANLARDRGATPAEVAGFRAAYLAQPGWVERSSELASAYVDAGDLQGAHDALDKAVALAPDDPDLLRSLAGVSMVDADYAGADRVTAALVRLAPHDSGALTLAAHVAMAQHRDSDRARALLREALRQNPADAEAAAYLLFLDRDVVGDEHLGPAEVADAAAGGSSDLAPRRGPARLIPDPDDMLRAHADIALAAVNRVRERAGLPAVHHDPRLDRSAAAHAFYWLFNNASPTVAKLGIHAETAGLPGFSGVHPIAAPPTWRWATGSTASTTASPSFAPTWSPSAMPMRRSARCPSRTWSSASAPPRPPATRRSSTLPTARTDCPLRSWTTSSPTRCRRAARGPRATR